MNKSKPTTLPRADSDAGQAKNTVKSDKQNTVSDTSKTVPTAVVRLEDQLKRALADYQNLERRIEEERRVLGQLSSAILIEKLLPALDNLESAQNHLNDQGLEIVVKQFKEILAQEGVSEIQAEGSQFDPNLHEATEVAEGEQDNKIVKVTRKGYKMNDKVLRPAQVVVERQKVDKNAESKAEKASEFGDYA